MSNNKPVSVSQYSDIIKSIVLAYGQTMKKNKE